MGPVWDWDNAFGSTYFTRGLLTNGWRFVTAQDPGYTWYRRLFEDPDFLQIYVDRWSELRTNVLATSNILSAVDDIARQVRSAQARNVLRWPMTKKMGLPVGPDVDAFEAEVTWLKDWLAGRLAWIDGQEFPKPVTQVVQTSSSDPPKLAMACLVGRLFYTTNNTDPRSPGGLPSANAREYSGPISLASNVTVTARVRSNYGLWSAPVVVGGKKPGNR